MKHIIPEAYTFDDLQIVPKYSKVLSRSDCELTTNISKDYSVGAVIAIGYRGDPDKSTEELRKREKMERVRKPLDEIVFFKPFND